MQADLVLLFEHNMTLDERRYVFYKILQHQITRVCMYSVLRLWKAELNCTTAPIIDNKVTNARNLLSMLN